MTIQQALELAIQHHQAGRLSEAEKIYRQILTHQSNHTDALNLLGMIESQKGRQQAAMEFIRQAIRINPTTAMYHNNLGMILGAQGQYPAAIEAYRNAIRLKPDYAEAHNNLGNAFKRQKQLPEAIGAFRLAVKFKPDYAEAHNNLGNALKDQHQLPEAIAEYRRAIALKPDLAEAHQNLGMTLREDGQLAEAIEAFRSALRIQPNYAEAYNTLGGALLAQGQWEAAISCFQESLRLKPDYAEAHNNLGNAFKKQNQTDEAIGQYRRAIECKPDLAEAHNNLGNAFNNQGQVAQAIVAYRRAIQLKPHLNQVHSNVIFTLHLDPESDARTIHDELLRWNQRHAAPLKKHIRPHANDRDPERPLRIGYVSGDFREHVVGWNLLPLFKEHHRELYEIFCYANSFHDDAITGQLRSCAAVWRNIMNLSDQQAAQLIRDDQIDILVDLGLHSADNRLPLFAYKPAPVQVTWLGYPGSTGLETIDYRFSDPYLDPPETDLTVYTEQTMRLAHTYWCYQPGGPAPEPAEPPVLEAGYVTFGCLNNFAKVSPAAMDLWTQILHRIPQARLIVHSKPGSHLDGVRERFGRAGINADRIEFIGDQSWPQYIETYKRIDIALDPFPYNGGITTCDSLYMGVPVVSLSGQTAVGRAGRSILSNVGLPELIAETPEQYVQIAIELANDRPRMAELHKTLRQRMKASALMDAKSFAADVEAAYRQMWRGYCAESNQITLTLVTGVRIVVPNSLELITPYVLQEQQDWFEDEIKFLRRLLEPGQKVIDIGANYGVYTLSMAQTVGPTGRVWAFEPASSSAQLLAQGIAANGFEHVVLERSALSDTCGTASISLNKDSEANALVHGSPPPNPIETVPLTTLDQCLERYDWRNIEFIKIDAEGEEANILKGGKRFFTEFSPLVEYELMADRVHNMELVKHFSTLGYDSYRLAPGLDLLVPFDAESIPDKFLLNLFCCKQDRAKRLAARGLLLDFTTHPPRTAQEHFHEIAQKLKGRQAYHWRNTIAQLPYGAQLAELWEQTTTAGNSAAVEEALSLYAMSRDSSLSTLERCSALAGSLDLLKILCNNQPSHLRLASLARVAQDFGARSLAVFALEKLSDAILKDHQVDLSEPFLAPGQRFDTLAPGAEIEKWILAATLEELERLGSFSSFFTTGAGAGQRLEKIHALGFGSAEMERRWQLFQKRLN
jgi:protein O-GlcNAc transferase